MKEGHLQKKKKWVNDEERNPQLHAPSSLLGNVSMVTVKAITLAKWQESIEEEEGILHTGI